MTTPKKARTKKKVEEKEEWISVIEFAKRKGIADNAARKAIARTGITTQKMRKDGKKLQSYVEWHEADFKFENIRKKRTNTTRGKKASGQDSNDCKRIGKVAKEPKISGVPNIDSDMKLDEVDGIPSKDGAAITDVDINDIDWTDADCMVRDSNGNERLSFELREKKYKGIRQKLAAQKQRGELLSKPLVEAFLSNTLSSTKNAIEILPERLLGIIVAICERYFGVPSNPEFRSEVMNELKKGTRKMLLDIIDRVNNMQTDMEAYFDDQDAD